MDSSYMWETYYGKYFFEDRKSPNYHRLDGPAIDENDGYKEWWVFGKKIDVSSQEEFERYIKLMAFL